MLVVVGVVTLAFSKGGDIRGWHAWQLWIPLGAAASFAIGNVLRRFGLTTTATAPLEGLTIDQTAAFIGLLIYAYSRRTRNMFSAPPPGPTFSSWAPVCWVPSGTFVSFKPSIEALSQLWTRWSPHNHCSPPSWPTSCWVIWNASRSNWPLEQC